MDDRVHLRDGVALGLKLLAVELERHLAGRIEFARDELQLDQQPGRAAGVVVAVLARPRAHDVRHEEADLGRREELARALARAFGEFPEQVFVGAAEEVGLHVGEAEPVARVGEGLDDTAQLGRVDVPLAVALGGEVDDVDDARQRRVVPHDGADGLGQVLADVLRRRGAASSSSGHSKLSRPLMTPQRASGGR